MRKREAICLAGAGGEAAPRREACVSMGLDLRDREKGGQTG